MFGLSKVQLGIIAALILVGAGLVGALALQTERLAAAETRGALLEQQRD